MDRTRTWNPRRGLAPAWIRRGASLALLVSLALSCGGPAKPPESPAARGEWRAFGGTGTASGHTQFLELGPGHTVAIFNMTGSFVLTGERGLGLGFRSEIIGFTDSGEGTRAWCVWTDSRGEKVFSEVRGGRVGTGSHFTGILRGGTGRYAGASGEYEFDWQYVVRREDGSIQGRAVGIRGRVRQDTIPSSAPGESPGSKRTRS